MRPLHRIVTFAAVLSTVSIASAAPPVRLIIMAGQSNMVGYGTGYDLPPALVQQQDIWYDHHNPDAREGWGYENATSTDWEPLAPMGSDFRYGPEVTFARVVADALPGEQIAIVKMSQGGTNIYEHWGRGLPAYTDEGPELLYKSQLYHLLMGTLDSAIYDEAHGNALQYPLEVTRVDHAIQRLQAAGVEFSVAGFIWMQGENEAGGKAAFQYGATLQAFADALREDLGTPALPFVLGRVSDNLYAANGGPIPEDRTPNVDAVRAAQVQFATTYPWGAWVDTDDLEPRSPDDAYHFTSEGYQILGERFAAAYLGVIERDVETDAGVAVDASDQEGGVAGDDSGVGPSGGPSCALTSGDGGDDGGCSMPARGVAHGAFAWPGLLLAAAAWLRRRERVRARRP